MVGEDRDVNCPRLRHVPAVHAGRVKGQRGVAAGVERDDAAVASQGIELV